MCTHTCATSSSTSVVVVTTCCYDGTAYARSSTRNYACLSTIGCPGSVGFINYQRTAVTNASDNTLAVGSCTKSVATGSVRLLCSNTGATSSNVTIAAAAANTLGGPATSFFYVGCRVPTGSTDTKCDPTKGFGGATCNATTNVATCGGVLPSTGNKVVRLTCVCAAVSWIVASVAFQPATFVADRVNNLCP